MQGVQTQKLYTISIMFVFYLKNEESSPTLSGMKLLA